MEIDSNPLSSSGLTVDEEISIFLKLKLLACARGRRFACRAQAEPNLACEQAHLVGDNLVPRVSLLTVPSGRRETLGMRLSV